MSTKVAKCLKNEELRTKFKIGEIVNIPIRIIYRYTNKLGVVSRPTFGRVVSMGNRPVGQHYRFAVDITSRVGKIEVWEEWQLEAIHSATKDQLVRLNANMPTYLVWQTQSPECSMPCPVQSV